MVRVQRLSGDGRVEASELPRFSQKHQNHNYLLKAINKKGMVEPTEKDIIGPKTKNP